MSQCYNSKYCYHLYYCGMHDGGVNYLVSDRDSNIVWRWYVWYNNEGIYLIKKEKKSTFWMANFLYLNHYANTVSVMHLLGSQSAQEMVNNKKTSVHLMYIWAACLSGSVLIQEWNVRLANRDPELMVSACMKCLPVLLHKLPLAAYMTLYHCSGLTCLIKMISLCAVSLMASRLYAVWGWRNF